jgi:hypothetical protein
MEHDTPIDASCMGVHCHIHLLIEMRSSLTFYLGWTPKALLPITFSVKGVSHWAFHPAVSLHV